MAVIQNDREKILDSSAIRVTSGSVTLTFSSQYFTTDVLGDTSPASITITANPSSSYLTQGSLPTYTWYYMLDLDPFNPANWTILSGETGSSLVVSKESFLSLRGSGILVRYKCVVSKSGMDSSFDFTTLTLIDNTAAASAVTGTLTNSSSLVPAGSDGTGYSLANSGGQFQLRVGGSLASGQTYSIVSGTDNGTTWSKTQNGLTLTINETTGNYSLTGGSWTSDSETFTLRSTYEGNNYDLVYNIAKVKQGSSGEGVQGDSARRAYTVTTLTSLGSGEVVVVAPNTLPPTNSVFGNGLTWSHTPPASLAVGERLFQSDGIFNPGTTNTTYTTPYLSSLKVGSLEAIVANTGSLNVTGALSIGTTGKVHSVGKDTYASATAGIFLGYDGGAYKLAVGALGSQLTFDGTNLSYPTSALSGTISNSQIASGLDAGKITTGTLPIDRIATGALTATKFASSIKPVEIVSSLPGTPHVEGRIVYLTSDDKLYRNTGSGWVKSVDGADVTSGINASNITTGSLPAARIAAGAIDATKFASTIKPVEVVTGLPAAPHTEGRVVYNTEDSKLYRNDGSGWTAEVLAEDVQGQFSSNQLNIAIGGGNLLYNTAFNVVNSSDRPIGYINTSLGSGITWTISTGIDSAFPNVKYYEIKINSVDTVPTSTSSHYLLGDLTEGIMPIIQADTLYTLSAYVQTNNINFRVQLRLDWRSSSLADLGASTVYLNYLDSTNTWYRIKGSVTPPPGAVYARIRLGLIRNSTSDTNTGYIRFRQLQLEEGDFATAWAPKPSEILPGSIGTTEIADDAITSPKIVAEAITAGKIAANAISANNIVSGTITSNKLYSGAVEADKIQASNLAAGSITAGKIAAGAVTATEIAANTISASKLVLSDTSNIVPDNAMLSDDSWTTLLGTGGSFVWETAPSGEWRSARVARLGANSDQYAFLFSQVFNVEPGAQYYISFQAQILAGSGTVVGQLQLSQNSDMSSAVYSTYHNISTTSVSTNTNIISIAANSGQRFARFRIYKSNNGPTSCYVGGLVVRRAATAELIVDGAITANKIQAGAVTTNSMTAGTIDGDRIAANTLEANRIVSNSITAGQIAAGAISATEIAAGAITATKLLVGDTSNVYPDYDMQDSSFYSGNGSYSFVNTGYTSTGQRRLRIDPNVSEVTVQTLWFQCEPDTDYYIEAHISRETGTTGTGDILVNRGILGSNGVVTWNGNFILANNISSTSTTTRVGISFKTGTTERRLMVVFRRDAGGDGQLTFGGVVIRRRAIGNLIVDGSVTADKIAANTITADKIAANTITADKIAANTITADKIAANTITTDKIASDAITADKIASNAITANNINANGLSIKDVSGNVLLEANGSPPPWVVAMDSVGSGTSLVESANTANNTAQLRTLIAGDGLSISVASGAISINSDSPATSIRLGSNKAFTSTSFSHVDGFFIPVEANSTYLITGYLRVRTPASTTGIRIGCETPYNATSGGAQTIFTATMQTTASTAERRTSYSAIGGATPVYFTQSHQSSSDGSTYSATAYTLLKIESVVVTGSIPGKFQLIAATEVSGSQLDIVSGSILRAEKINTSSVSSSTTLATAPAGISSSYSSSDVGSGTLAEAITSITIKTDGTWVVTRTNQSTVSGTWLGSGSASGWDVFFDVTSTSGSTGITRSNSATTYSQLNVDKIYNISAYAASGTNVTRSGNSVVAIRFRNRNTGSVTLLQTVTLTATATSEYFGGIIP